MSTPVRALLLAALLTLAPVTIGVAKAGDPTAQRGPRPYVATPLEQFDTAATRLRRASFCSRLPAAAARAAVGARATVAAYGNGQTTPPLTGLPQGDVAHEFGCTVTPATDAAADAATAGAVARGWVFAPPITPTRAASIVEAAAKRPGCTVRAGAPAFGSPSAGLLCEQDGVRTASYEGLFGDSWLACSLTLPATVTADDVVARAGTWCVAVARAAAVSAP